MPAEVHFFDCGNGDTILIRGGKEWALVDANFTKPSGSKERLIQKLKDHGVSALRFVCVTHFDTDHIRGLGRFLKEQFGPDGKERTKWMIEQIILPVRPENLWELLHTTSEDYQNYLGKNDEATEALDQLLMVLKEIWYSDPSILHAYSPRTRLVAKNLNPKAAPLGPWDVWFLGPSSTIEGIYMQDFHNHWGLRTVVDRKQWPKELRARVEKNETSRVIALHHRRTQETVFLPGDATAKSISESLIEFSNVEDDERHAHFRCVKASHHGAWVDCHCEDLYTVSCKPNVTEIVITCRDADENHPHLKTVTHFQSLSLSAYSTGTPHPSVVVPTPRRSGWVPMNSPKARSVAHSRDVILRINDEGSKISGGHKICPAEAVP